jgi:hypothetical protein
MLILIRSSPPPKILANKKGKQVFTFFAPNLP